MADEITEFHSGVQISWDVPEDELVQLAKVKFFDRQAIVRVIKDELQKYPKGLLGKYISKIYLSRTAMVDGHRVGGVARGGNGEEGGIIFLTSWNDPKPELVRRLHHEIAHHVMYAASDAQAALGEWQKLLPEDVGYFGNGLEAIKAGVIDSRASETLFERGFVSPYAMAAIEEDFAEVSAGLFSGDKHFWDLVDDYPLIKQKAELAARVYQSIDPQYDLKYFRFRF